MSEVRRPEAAIERLTVDGVDVLWSRSSGPAQVDLVFRSGTADEPYTQGGLSHLVEHLAFFTLGEPEYDHNGFVTDAFTVFYASGTDAEMRTFVEAISAGIADLPLDRLEAEKGVLRAEAESRREYSVCSRMLVRRCGLGSYGADSEPELGLRTVTPTAVSAWASERFTKGNAVVCWTSTHPPEFVLALADGPRVAPPPPPTPIPAFSFPLAIAEGGGGVSIGMVSPRTTSAALVMAVAARRLERQLRHEDGLVYSVDSFWDRLDAGHAHTGLVIECNDGVAARVRSTMLDALSHMVADGPEEADLGAEIRDRSRSVADDRNIPGLLFVSAMDLLLGRPVEDRDTDWDELQAVTTTGVRDALSNMWPSALLVSPEVIRRRSQASHRLTTSPAAHR